MNKMFKIAKNVFNYGIAYIRSFFIVMLIMICVIIGFRYLQKNNGQPFIVTNIECINNSCKAQLVENGIIINTVFQNVKIKVGDTLYCIK